MYIYIKIKLKITVRSTMRTEKNKAPASISVVMRYLQGRTLFLDRDLLAVRVVVAGFLLLRTGV